jgi:DNA-binding MarR family transcriptional regulator
MPTVPTDPRHLERYDLGLRIGLAWRTLRRGASWYALREYLYGSGDEAIEQGMMDTLDVLALQPSWRMSDLADVLRVDPSTATRAVQRLEKAGLAERRPSTADGRVVEVEATDAGRAQHEAVAERRAVLMTHVMRAYRREELPVFAEMFERFVVSIDEFVATRDTDA